MINRDLLFYLILFITSFPVITIGQINDKDSDDYYYYSELKRNVDDFTDEISFNTPFGGPLVLYKTISKNKNVKYYLSFNTRKSSLYVNKKGVYILFSDGTKMSKPEAKIDVDVEDGAWRYSAFVPLTLNDLSILKRKNIKKFRMYVFDVDIAEVYSEEIRGSAKIIHLAK